MGAGEEGPVGESIDCSIMATDLCLGRHSSLQTLTWFVVEAKKCGPRSRGNKRGILATPIWDSLCITSAAWHLGLSQPNHSDREHIILYMFSKSLQ